MGSLPASLDMAGAQDAVKSQILLMLVKTFEERPNAEACCGNDYVPARSSGRRPSPAKEVEKGEAGAEVSPNLQTRRLKALESSNEAAGADGTKQSGERPSGLSIITKKSYLQTGVVKKGLPPLGREPVTPMVKGATAIVQKGDTLLRATGQSPRMVNSKRLGTDAGKVEGSPLGKRGLRSSPPPGSPLRTPLDQTKEGSKEDEDEE